MMTEEQIEGRVEKIVDHLDRLFMAGQLTQRQYDAEMKAVNQWAENKLSKLLPYWRR